MEQSKVTEILVPVLVISQRPLLKLSENLTAECLTKEIMIIITDVTVETQFCVVSELILS